INSSRGEVVDVDAALHSLWSDHLAGLALDVYSLEPPPQTWPDDPRLILTPHIAGCTAEAKREAGIRMYRELCGFYGFEPVE
ncbi:MAG: NAD(P)-dependent oxidoreductase, partial [Thermoanaerobaculia bacterium]|nr:NAD(P)-dependent oxidoreductase [Thermoanaerobaculia bacterium]